MPCEVDGVNLVHVVIKACPVRQCRPRSVGRASLRYKEKGGNSAAGRSNHLILNDTDQKIQAQLKSDHQHSALSLGHLTRIDDNAGRKDALGEGFELRSDGHGVIRAKDGLLLTTEGRANAAGHAKDMGETTERLNAAHAQHQLLAEAAQVHKAQDKQSDQDEVHRALHTQQQEISGQASVAPDSASNRPVAQSIYALFAMDSGARARTGTGISTGAEASAFPELAKPHLVLASPAGKAATS